MPRALTNSGEADLRENFREKSRIAGTLGMASVDLRSGGKGILRLEDGIFADSMHANETHAAHAPGRLVPVGWALGYIRTGRS